MGEWNDDDMIVLGNVKWVNNTYKDAIIAGYEWRSDLSSTHVFSQGFYVYINMPNDFGVGFSHIYFMNDELRPFQTMFGSLEKKRAAPTQMKSFAKCFVIVYLLCSWFCSFLGSPNITIYHNILSFPFACTLKTTQNLHISFCIVSFAVPIKCERIYIAF